MRIDTKLQILDLTVVIVAFTIGCLVGSEAYKSYRTWISFNASTMGVFAVGMIIWWRVRKRLVRKWMRE